MSDKRASVLMVGSVPAETAEDVFRLLGPALGEQLIGMSDGEPGFRNKWIVFNAPHVFEPHPDLVIQWDVCWEVFSCDANDYLGREPLAWRASGYPFERFGHYIERLSPRVPEQVILGMHLCYGDLEHTHLIEPRDLGIAVRMANLAVSRAGRRLDFVHMPAPRNRTDDAYFEPLADLHPGSGKLFIGLVHLTDGTQGSLRRLATFKRHYRGPHGIATECGWGRRKAETIPALMQIHREVAEAL